MTRTYIFLLIFSVCAVYFSFFLHQSYSETYSRNIYPECEFAYDEISKYQCYQTIVRLYDPCESTSYPLNATNIRTKSSPHPSPFDFNATSIRTELPSSVNFVNSSYSIWKSKVHPIPRENYHNVGEPSFSSNGTDVFYTGNHFAARSKIGSQWNFVDPSFDFKALERRGNITSGNTTSGNFSEINLFRADQRTIYDPHHKMYMWVRLGDAFDIGQNTNIVRLAISNDTLQWIVYDLVPIEMFTSPDIIDSTFDYPDMILSKDYLYLTSSLTVGEHCEKEYGAILRVPLSNLSDSLNNIKSEISVDAILDRNVTGIAPVNGFYNSSVFFGAHIKNTSQMKVYEWNEDTNSFSNKTVSIAPWNNIHSAEYCGTDRSRSDTWWCKANTSSRIRSAWLYENSLHFMWNSVTTYDNGVTWKPYIDVASFDIKRNMTYERKYYIADNFKPWIFGSAVPNVKGELGVIAYYYTSNNSNPNIDPYLNLAFGKFNHSSNKWDMISLINSSATLPVKDENMNKDYNFGDYLTIRKHPADKEGYLWDMGGYVIVGKNYYNVEPYFIMIK